MFMGNYAWDNEKNGKLVRERGVSFEEVLLCIEEGRFLDVICSANEKYKHQKQFVVEIRGYIYLVPFVDSGERIFLKTIIPSRKMTQKHKQMGGA